MTPQTKREWILGSIILAVIACVAIATPVVIRRLNNRIFGPKYAMLLGEHIVDYMKANDGRWPTEWEDLRPYIGDEKLFAEVRKTVAIDFDFKPSSVDTTIDRHNHGVSIAPVSLTNGAALNHEDYPDPNAIIFDYLKNRAESSTSK